MSLKIFLNICECNIVNGLLSKKFRRMLPKVHMLLQTLVMWPQLCVRCGYSAKTLQIVSWVFLPGLMQRDMRLTTENCRAASNACLFVK